MTRHRFVISDCLRQPIAPLLPDKAMDRCVTPQDNRLFLEAVLDARGAIAVIPPRASRNHQRACNKEACKWRHLMEKSFARIKEHRDRLWREARIFPWRLLLQRHQRVGRWTVHWRDKSRMPEPANGIGLSHDAPEAMAAACPLPEFRISEETLTNHAAKGLESPWLLPASAPMHYFVLSILARQRLLRRSRSNHASTPEAASRIMGKVSQAKGAAASEDRGPRGEWRFRLIQPVEAAPMKSAIIRSPGRRVAGSPQLRLHGSAA